MNRPYDNFRFNEYSVTSAGILFSDISYYSF
jgi:hypothetical protein